MLATIRTPNLPSVACNVATGIWLASIGSQVHSLHVISAISSGILLYLAGNLLNDWRDRDWDAIHRPERALPKDIFRPSTYLSLAIACSFAALAISASNPRALAIASGILGLILVYTNYHKSSSLAALALGLCRAALPALGYFACSDEIPTPSLIFIATALLLHTCGISFVARGESKPHRQPNRLLLIAYPLAITITCLAASTGELRAWLAAVPFLLWTYAALFLLRKSVFTCVSMLLAGIPLVDWIFLTPLTIGPEPSLPWLALSTPPIAFILGKVLQKIAPAS